MVDEGTRKVSANISSPTTTFPFTFRILSTSDILVYRTDVTGTTTLLTESTNYNVVDSGGDDYQSGGEVEIVDPAEGYSDGNVTIL